MVTRCEPRAGRRDRRDVGSGLLLKIMPLGDSITFGAGSATGSYRTELWKDFGSDPNKLSFLGSLEAGPPELGNKHTEGHSGFTIANEPGSGYGNITDSISGYLNPRVSPDIILLMIGTNDINRQFEEDQAPAKLDHLISLISDRTTGLRPNAKLIVSNILPIDDMHNQFAWPGADSNRNNDVDIFNATIPGIVAAHRWARRKCLLYRRAQSVHVRRYRRWPAPDVSRFR